MTQEQLNLLLQMNGELMFQLRLANEEIKRLNALLAERQDQDGAAACGQEAKQEAGART